MNPWIPHLLRAGGGGGGPVLPPAGRTMLANLTSSLILDEGTGGPTWSRATKAWGFNELGYLEELASGCAFFGGARLVRNTVRTTSEDFSNAAWVKSNCTVTGTNTIVCANATNLQRISQDTSGAALVTGMKMFYSFRVAYVSGGASFIQITGTTAGFGSGQHANFSLLDGTHSEVGCTASSSLVSPGVYDISCVLTATATANQDAFYACFVNDLAAARFASFTGDGIKSFDLLRAWSCDVTNYDASYVPEYVSVGSDTDKNFLLHTDDFSQANWSKSNITLTQSAIANPVNGLINAPKVEATAGATTYLAQFVSNSGSANGNILAFYVKKGSGANDANKFLLRNNTTSTAIVSISLNYDTGVVTHTTGSGTVVIDVGGGWYRIEMSSSSGFSLNDTVGVYLGFASSVETAGEFCYIYRPYLGRGTTAPAVLPAVAGVWDPFGSGSDGAKYFETDWQGAPIATANLLKVRREASAINNLLYSRDLSNAAWSTKTNITAAKTATGLDGIANTATTLTATAADATILQPTSGIASAARCASAYVKRRTGTGTISFTQDGGSTWTDITSQINSSTWSRVEITATLANPSVGFKISTSGDAIDVDCVQNEAGSVATSPIVTTTAAVTRNADSLTYQTASNIDAALGTLFCEYSVYEQTSAAPRTIIGLSTSAATVNALLLHATSVATPSLSSGDGTTIFAKTGLGSAVNTKRKAAVSWGTGRSLTAEGLATQSGVFSGTLPSVAIAPGAYTNGTFPLNGYIGPVAIYNYQMTDAELQALTT